MFTSLVQLRTLPPWKITTILIRTTRLTCGCGMPNCGMRNSSIGFTDATTRWGCVSLNMECSTVLFCRLTMGFGKRISSLVVVHVVAQSLARGRSLALCAEEAIKRFRFHPNFPRLLTDSSVRPLCACQSFSPRSKTAEHSFVVAA